MASTTYEPTSANILASLGIRGTALSGGAGAAGKVPVIGQDGLLDVSLMPVDAIASRLSILPFGKTAYVDKDAGTGNPGYVPNGSSAFPFRTLSEAAAYEPDSSDSDAVGPFSGFILVSGNYGAESPVFKTRDSAIRIVSTGRATFSNLTLYGYVGGTQFEISGVSVTGTLYPASSVTCSVSLYGEGKVGALKGAISNPASPASSTWYLSAVRLGPDVDVTSFTYVRPSAIAYLASSARMANASADVPGKSVSDAVSRLGGRRVRMPTFTADSDGLHAATTDVSAEDDSSDSYGYHDLTELGTTLAEAANDTFYKEGDSPTFGDVKADNVAADTVTADAEVLTTRVNLGGPYLFVDSDNFLTVDREGAMRFQTRGDDEYFKSRIEGGVQHYVKQEMRYDEEIGWGAVWTGDYVLVDGQFVNLESSDSPEE